MEAKNVFFRESPLDLYSWPINTSELLWFDEAKHIICGTEQIKDYFDVEARRFDNLRQVTIIDSSKFFRNLTAGKHSHPPKPSDQWNGRNLSMAVAVLLGRGVKTILIRSAKLMFKRREIRIRNTDAGVEVFVRGIRNSWNDRAEKQIRAALAPDPRLMSSELSFAKWEFQDEQEKTVEGPYDFRVDYYSNLLDRNGSGRKVN